MPTYPWQRERHWFESNYETAVAPCATPACIGSGAPRGVAGFPRRVVYELNWVDVDGAADVPNRASDVSHHWVVFGNGDVGDRIVAELGARGDTSTLVRAASSASSASSASGDVAANTFDIDASSDTELPGRPDARCQKLHGIIHAWSATSVDDEPQFDELWDAQLLGCRSVGRLVRALTAADNGCQRHASWLRVTAWPTSGGAGAI